MTEKTFSDKMNQKSVLCLVIVTVIVLAIVFLSTTSSGYCNCTGMATAFDNAPYTFWRGAEYPLPYEAKRFFDWDRGQLAYHALESPTREWALHPELPFEKSGVQRLGSAYGPSENTVRDVIRDKQDGMIGLETTGELLRDKLDGPRRLMEMEMLAAPGYKLGCATGLCGGAGAYMRGGAMADRGVWPSANRSELVPLGAVGGRLPPGAVEYNTTRFGDGKFMEPSPIGAFRYGGYGTAAETNMMENAYGDAPNYYDLRVGVL